MPAGRRTSSPLHLQGEGRHGSCRSPFVRLLTVQSALYLVRYRLTWHSRGRHWPHRDGTTFDSGKTNQVTLSPEETARGSRRSARNALSTPAESRSFGRCAGGNLGYLPDISREIETNGRSPACPARYPGSISTLSAPAAHSASRRPCPDSRAAGRMATEKRAFLQIRDRRRPGMFGEVLALEHAPRTMVQARAGFPDGRKAPTAPPSERAEWLAPL